MPNAFGQTSQHGKLTICQANLPSLARGRQLPKIYGHVSQSNLIGLFLCPTEDGMHASQQFIEGERLREVVIRAEVETSDLIGVLISCSDYNYRSVIGTFAQPATNLKTI